MLHRNITPLISGCTPDDGDINRWRAEIEPFLVVKRHPFHQVFFGEIIHPPPFMPGVEIGVHAHLGQDTWSLGSCFPVHVKDDAAWDIVGLHLIGINHLPDFW